MVQRGGWWRFVLIGMLVAAVGWAPAETANAQHDELGINWADVTDNSMPLEALPPQLGQHGQRMLVRESGYSVGGIFLDYWRANGAESVYGHPISEPYLSVAGRYSQVFERGVFQYRPDVLFTADPVVRLMPVGQMSLDARISAGATSRSDGRRMGGDRRSDRWQRSATSVSEPFAAWYDAHEGDFYLGDAIGEALRERGVNTQYFAGGALLDDGFTVWLAPLGREQRSLTAAPEAKPTPGGYVAYDESQFLSVVHPGTGELIAPTPARKRIEIDLDAQRLVAYQGNDVIVDVAVSTGLDPNITNTGRFHIRIKRVSETMAGFTSGSGEVIAFEEEDLDGEEADRYEVEDVPHVMYFSLDAEAMHGAYWHNNFGTPMSHGCVNLPLDVAAFLFGWAPLGTELVIVP